MSWRKKLSEYESARDRNRGRDRQSECWYPRGFTFDSVHLPRADVKAGTEAATAAAQPRVLPGEEGEDVR